MKRFAALGFGLALLAVPAPAYGQASADQVMQRIDANSDRVIERIEVADRTPPWFDRADANNDDRIDGDEWAAAQAGLAAARQRGPAR